MSIRDQRQNEFADIWIEKDEWGILHLCPRFGKIYTTINIFEKKFYKNILIAYPDLKIKDSWEKDLITRKYSDSMITYTTHLSLKKYVDESYDLIVIDEIHLLSIAQIKILQQMKIRNRKILGLTGTLAADTKKWLLQALYLPVIATYSMDQGISEGVVADYDITVVTVPLDNYTLQVYKKQRKTEKKQFDMLTYVVNKQQVEGRDTMFMRLARMRIIQHSIAKRDMTRDLINDNADKRILVFCGVTAIADDLTIPSYHSKSSEKKVFQDFAEGKGNHLAVVKIGNTGVTYKPLNFVIINYFDSNAENLAQRINRCMSMEYDNPDKKAHIYIVSTTERVELAWLTKALEFFDKSKIKYL
jgi:superfamily II DNA or RNA helicase